MLRVGLRPHHVAVIGLLLCTVCAPAALKLPFDSTSPVIYDNDGAVESGFSDVYVMALASAGAIDLRGIISTGTYGERPPFIPRTEDHILLERRELVAKARRSGMRNIPDPSPGPGVSLSSRRPPSGVIEETKPVGAKGSWLIVNEARRATAAKPLVVIMGGQGSALADAYLLDNSIADKVVALWLVGGKRNGEVVLHGFEYNAYTDLWATQIIFEKLRLVVFPVEDAPHVPHTPKSRFGQLPKTELRQHILEIGWPRGDKLSEPEHNWDALGALALTQPNLVLATKQIALHRWEKDIWGGAHPVPVWKEDQRGRVTMVSRVSAALATDEWWRRMMDPAIWGPAAGATPYNGLPAAVPGTIEAEHFDHGGTGVAYWDSTNNWSSEKYFSDFRFLEHVNIHASKNAGAGYFVTLTTVGEWLRYSLTAAHEGDYTLEVKVASAGAGGTFHVEFSGIDKTGPLTIPDTGGWETWLAVTKTGVRLEAGPQVMRLVMDTNGAAGQVGNFDALRLSVTRPDHRNAQ